MPVLLNFPEHVGIDASYFVTILNILVFYEYTHKYIFLTLRNLIGDRTVISMHLAVMATIPKMYS